MKIKLKKIGFQKNKLGKYLFEAQIYKKKLCN